MDISSNIYFLARDEKYDRIKPYNARYDPKGKFPYTNIDSAKFGVILRDMRPLLRTLEWEKCGFQVVAFEPKVSYEDLQDEKAVKDVHIPSLLHKLKSVLKASNVYELDHMIRKRDSTFPIASGQLYQNWQPASRAHLDYTYDSVCELVQKDFQDEAEDILSRPWQVVNIWHPLRGPLVDWPLGVCSSSSVDFASDTMAGDLVDLNGSIENTQVHHNTSQEWYYLSDQMPSELLVFKNADSRANNGTVSPGVPHSSFHNPNFKEGDFLRESLEMRVLVTF